jgi:enterochelin esterase-like enzyme
MDYRPPGRPPKLPLPVLVVVDEEDVEDDVVVVALAVRRIRSPALRPEIIWT